MPDAMHYYSDAEWFFRYWTNLAKANAFDPASHEACLTHVNKYAVAMRAAANEGERK
jgi:hypothetical protein